MFPMAKGILFSQNLEKKSQFKKKNFFFLEVSYDFFITILFQLHVTKYIIMIYMILIWIIIQSYINIYGCTKVLPKKATEFIFPISWKCR